MNRLQLLSETEAARRRQKVIDAMHRTGTEALLVSTNANIYYLTGRVFRGYIYITESMPTIYFVKRPIGLAGDGVVYIRKPEQIIETLGLNSPQSIALELDSEPWSTIERLKKIFSSAEIHNASAALRIARSVKTEEEIAKLRLSAEKQCRVYRKIPSLFSEGMTDAELQIEIERLSRLEGCLGQFRINGGDMELYMGNVISGENADTPTPYDFAMGGGGMDPSLPVGCNGSIIHRGETVMVDMNGNFSGYMTDMTRTFVLGQPSQAALKAHSCSIEICQQLALMATEGTEAKAMYFKAEEIAKQYGLSDYFMGHKQKAGFVGHGVGIEINELPVIAPRSRDIIEAGNVIALEPKFVIPGVGAVGIENTYVATANGLQLITQAPEELEEQ